MEAQHEAYMQQCLALARLALEAGNPPVGALIVSAGIVIGTGIESGKSSGDITRHAEIEAIRNAIQNGYGAQLNKACLYTTHEPCIMCAYVIRHHHIPELVYGIEVPYIGGQSSAFNLIDTNEIPKWGTGSDVIKDICRGECAALNEQFQQTLNK